MRWPPSFTRSIGSATRYSGGRTRIGRRRFPEPEWPYLVFFGLLAVIAVGVIIGLILG